MPRAFVIRPFNTKKDSAGKEIDFEHIHKTLIQPALDASDMAGSTTGEIIDAGNIREDMFALILEADLVICDITIHNANVFYELGIRHALRKGRTILIKGGPVKDRTPFDLQTDRYLGYEISNPDQKLDNLIQTIQATMASNRPTDSPIFKLLPTLPEANPENIIVLPVDFQEEVLRAKAVKSKGWLRLLAQEVRGMRFEKPALKLIGKELWKGIQDYEAARDCFERVIMVQQNDIESHLALSNIYERLSRSENNSDLLLQLSNQSIDRVVKNPDAPARDKVEALTLKGRNLKTMWRKQFDSLEKIEDRRDKAMNEKLRESFEAYLNAFQEDLNHFYSGLAAWQMGSIFVDLVQDSEEWKYSFDDDKQADDFKSFVDESIVILSHTVTASINRSLKILDKMNDGRIWAEISNCDAKFLLGEDNRRMARRYRDAIPDEKSFAWNSAKGQLKLFASLGVKGDFANEVIELVDAQIKEEKYEEEKPLHVILFAGHMVDVPERTDPRFPVEKVEAVQQLIEQKLEEVLSDTHTNLGLASAGPGGDILFHEICAGLKVPANICLPYPFKDFAKNAFKEMDDWRTRFLELIKNGNVLELSHQSTLPRWLQGTRKDFWERGNQWVLQMALAEKAEKVTLIAFWNHSPKGNALGGTAHMVQLARDAGIVDVKIIDARQILAII